MEISINLNAWEFIALNLIGPLIAGTYYTIKHYLTHRKEKPIIIKSTGQKED